MALPQLIKGREGLCLCRSERAQGGFGTVNVGAVRDCAWPRDKGAVGLKGWEEEGEW